MLENPQRYPKLGKLSLALIEGFAEKIIGERGIDEVKRPYEQNQIAQSLNEIMARVEDVFLEQCTDKQIRDFFLQLPLRDLDSVKTALWVFYKRPNDNQLAEILKEQLKSSKSLADGQIESGVKVFIKLLKLELANAFPDFGAKIMAHAAINSSETAGSDIQKNIANSSTQKPSSGARSQRTKARENRLHEADEADMQSETPHLLPKPQVERYWPVVEKKLSHLEAHPNLPKTILGNPFPYDHAENDLHYLFSERGFFWTGHPLCRILKARNEFTIISGEEGSGKTAFARAYGQYLCDRTVLTCYVNQPLQFKEIQAQFTKRVLDFIRANPLYLPGNANALLLAQWLKTHHKLTIRAWLDDTRDMLREAKWINDVEDTRKKEMYLAEAQKRIVEFQALVIKRDEPVFTAADELEVLLQCATSLGFKRVRVVFDLSQKPRGDDIENMDDFLRESQNRIETIIFTQPGSVWQKQFGGNATVMELTWRQGTRNLLEEMILYRWGLVSREHLQASAFERDAFEYLLEVSNENPRRFIQLWNKVIDLKSSVPKISVELIKKTVAAQPEGSRVPLQNQQPAMDDYGNAVFVSYAWGGESERTVDGLERAFSERGIRLVRDKKDLGYKGSIEAFEQRLGQGHCIVLVISDKYLRSEHCMYELVEVDKNQHLRERVFPIVLADARIYKAIDRLIYIKHWDEQIEQLNRAIKKVGVVTNLTGIMADLDKYARIRASFDHLTDLLSDMNALTPEMHAANGFSTLLGAVERVLAEKKTASGRQKNRQ